MMAATLLPGLPGSIAPPIPAVNSPVPPAVLGAPSLGDGLGGASGSIPDAARHSLPSVSHLSMASRRVTTWRIVGRLRGSSSQHCRISEAISGLTQLEMGSRFLSFTTTCTTSFLETWACAAATMISQRAPPAPLHTPERFKRALAGVSGGKEQGRGQARTRGNQRTAPVPAQGNFRSKISHRTVPKEKTSAVAPVAPKRGGSST